MIRLTLFDKRVEDIKKCRDISVMNSNTIMKIMLVIFDGVKSIE